MKRMACFGMETRFSLAAHDYGYEIDGTIRQSVGFRGEALRTKDTLGNVR